MIHGHRLATGYLELLRDRAVPSECHAARACCQCMFCEQGLQNMLHAHVKSHGMHAMLPSRLLFAAHTLSKRVAPPSA